MMDGIRSGPVGGYGNPQQQGKDAALGIQPSPMKLSPYPGQYAHALLKPGSSMAYGPRMEASPFKGRLTVPTARPHTPPGSSHTIHPPVLGGHQMVYSAPGGGRTDFSLVPPSAPYELNAARGFRSPPGVSNTQHERRRLTLLPTTGDFGPPMHGHGQIFPHQLGAEMYRENIGAYHPPPMGLSLLSGAADSQHLDHGPYKRLRLSGDNKTDPSQPLKIDTRGKEPMYTPQVEAISPTPGDRDADDSPSRSTKDELLQQISKVDRDIATAESSVLKLKRKQQELEESSSRGTEDKDIETPKSRHRSLPQIIYSENRKKASEAHGSLAKLGPVVEFPLYNQPQDMPVYHENLTKYSSFRPRLIEFLKRQKKEVEEWQSKKMAAYTDRLSLWMKRVDRIERGISPPPYDPNPPVVQGGITFAIPVLPKKRERDQRNRETFEKVFPELRKQREDKERLSRAGSRVKSDADLEEIMDGLQEQENEDKKMRSLAVVPPLMLDSRQRRLYYDNRNGVVEDPMDEHRERQLLNVWTEQEKEIFKEKYLQHPKGFVVISSFLERKSVADCVHYYYTSKKTENYKQLLRKSRARTRARTVQKAQPQQQQDLTVGVTTRLQREALMKQGETSAMANAAVLVQGESVQISEVKGDGSEEKVITKEEVEKVSTVVIQESAVVEEPAAPRASEALATPVVTSSAETVSVSVNQVAEIVVQVKEEPQTPQSAHEEEPVKTTTTVTTINKEVVVTCVVCQASVPLSSSRSLLTKDASMFGMKETDIVEGSRVCVTCRCNGVRRRLVNCPIPTCPTPKRRVKRLRPLPSKWLEMSMESKSQIISELQIPPDITRCCAACVNRISRRVGLFDSGSDVSEPSRRDSEVDESEGSSTSSNEEDVPDDRLQINEAPEAVQENRPKVPEFPRIEVSEMKVEPAVVIEPQPPPPLKDDYDSSETISADECQSTLDIDEGAAPQLAADNGVRPIYGSSPVVQPVQSQGRPSRPPSTNKESITIKELMHGVIERSIKRKEPAPSPTARPSAAHGEIPTITSILKDNQGYINQRPDNRAPLVSDQHRIASPHYPPSAIEWNQHPHLHHQREIYSREQAHRELYIQPRDDKRVLLDARKPVFASQAPPRENIGLMVAEQHAKEEEQNETLDLSIKRDRESSPARAPVAQKPVNVPLRPSPGAAFVRQPAPFPREHEPVYEKPHPYSGGSITQGTPVNVDKSRKVVTSSVKDVPLQTVLFDHRTGHHVYLDRDRLLVTPQPREQQRKPSPSRGGVEQKSNVLLYSDYMLSQQMIRKERELPRHNSPLSAEHAAYLAGAVQQPFLQSQEKKVEQYPPGYAPNHYAPKPVHHRQGVIQHTPVGSVRFPQPQIPKPGGSQPMQLDFFADVVASQPSLPVPDKKEKDRPSPLPNPVPAHRGKQSNGELDKERHWAHHEVQRGLEDKPHGVTADSLIDQIVTRQMGSGVPRCDKAEMERMFPRYSKDSKIPEGYRPGVHEVATKPITLGEHIDSIITKDFARPGYEGEPPFAPFISNAWRERDPRSDPRHSHHPEKEHRPEVKPSHLAGLRAPAPVPRSSPSEAPGGSRPQIQDRHPQIQDRHHQMPERHAQMSERHLAMSDRHPHLPDRHTQSMERHHQMSERNAQIDRHMLERHAQMTDRHMLERHSLQERHQQISERHPPQVADRHQVMMRPATPQSHYLQRERMVQEQIKESWQTQRRMDKSSPQVFDYVKNKIAEVMRTEDAPSDHQDKADPRPGPAPSPSKRPRIDEDKSRQSPFQRVDPNFGPKSRPSPNGQNPPSPYQQMPNYGYPYGVMTVRNPNPSQSPSTAHRSQPPSPAPAPAVSTHVTMPSSATPTAPSPHSRQVHAAGVSGGKEPAPLLSAQYEPLSDED